MTLPVLSQTDQRDFVFINTGFNDRWFEQGHFAVASGQATGLTSAIKHDRLENGRHRITLWQALRGTIQVGDRVKLIAGCDRGAETCRAKFSNLVNFRGFPDMPGDDWLMSVPRSDDAGGGESLVR